MQRSLVACAAVLALVGAGCPKKHKPPPMSRVWLGPTDACVALRTGVVACAGTRTGTDLPVPVEFGAPVLEMALGGRYACALREDGRVACKDASGDAGGGAVVVAEARAAVGLAAGAKQACAVMLNGTHACWGEGPAVDLGGQKVAAVAVGAVEACLSLHAAPGASARVRCARSGDVVVGEDVTQITMGAEHGCVLLAGGRVRCWGKNGDGQLGDGGVQDAKAAVAVSGLESVAEIRAGARHTCARMQNGTVACWGANDRHQLADGTTSARSRPLPIFGIVAAQELAAAGDATCARLQDHSVRCWGGNDAGQLGDGTRREHPVPMPVKWPAAEPK